MKGSLHALSGLVSNEEFGPLQRVKLFIELPAVTH